MSLLDDLSHDPGCTNNKCRFCLKHADMLLGELQRLTGEDYRADLAGAYHGWLSKNGIAPETDGGWWSREALSDANAKRFAEERTAIGEKQ